MCTHSVSAISLENVNMPVHTHRTLGGWKFKMLTVLSTGQEVGKYVIVVNLTHQGIPQLRNWPVDV